MASSEYTQLLSAALRAATTRAAELAGGSALLFAQLPEDPQGESAGGRLRAAAGFGSIEDARSVAASLASAVVACVESGRPTRASGPADGSVVLLPLAVEGRSRGALAIASPAPLEKHCSQTLGMLAASAALQVDHAHLLDEIESLRREGSGRNPSGEERGDEVLRLSEALFAQDIELLRHQEKLGQIEKIKSDFIEKMSRELRTPLNGIIEACISVLAGENEHLSEAAKSSLRLALDEGTTFQRTLQNILDLWRIKQGEMPVEIQDLNLSEVVDEAIFSVQDGLQGRPVVIEKEIAEPFPKIKTDLAKLNQVLFLLLDNAVKFTNEGTITIAAQVADGELHCQIRDTGIGICPDDQQYIFDEFFQVDAHSSSSYRGAGLGLSLARDVLSLLEGRCSISSEPGRGTTASFEIPVQTS